MELLNNVGPLNKRLLDVLETEYYRKKEANYVYVDYIKLVYDEKYYSVDLIDIVICYGRYYEEEEKKSLNEDNTVTLKLSKQSINDVNYLDVISGMFIQAINSK